MKISQRKFLTLSLKVGAGHLRAAQATEVAIRERYENVDTTHFDVLDYTTRFYRSVFTTLYGTMIANFPFAWKTIYEQTRKQQLTGFSKRTASWLTARNSRKLLSEIHAYQPDAIICTHFTAAEAVASARVRKELSVPVCVVLTDYDLHSAWLHRGVDCYCVGNEQMATDLRRLELFGAAVHVTGIPIHPLFANEFPHRQEMRTQLKLDPDAPTLLLTGGGCGLGALHENAQILLKNFPNAQIIAVAGGNVRMRVQLEGLARENPRLIVRGYISNMHEYMAASDLIVTKPGGLTSSECLAMGLPAVVSRPIPGQEEHNCEFLVANQVALRARNTSELLVSVRALLEDEGLRHYMSSRARSLAKRRAAFTVAEIAWDLMEKNNAKSGGEIAAPTPMVVPPGSVTPVTLERSA